MLTVQLAPGCSVDLQLRDMRGCSGDFTATSSRASSGFRQWGTDTALDAPGDRPAARRDPATDRADQYCDKYSTDWQFRLFFEQVHMFIWFIANGDYLKKIDEINKELNGLMLFLEKENLLMGLTIDRSPINVSELSRPLAPTNSGSQFDRQL